MAEWFSLQKWAWARARVVVVAGGRLNLILICAARPKHSAGLVVYHWRSCESAFQCVQASESVESFGPLLTSLLED